MLIRHRVGGSLKYIENNRVHWDTPAHCTCSIHLDHCTGYCVLVWMDHARAKHCIRVCSIALSMHCCAEQVCSAVQ